MLKLRDVSKVHRTGDIETTALKNISLDIERGEYVAIMGPSGCGKSTLLSVLGMLDSFTSGEYLFGDQKVFGRSETELSQLRRKRIAFIFQNFNLIDELSVSENISLALEYADVGKSERRKRTGEMMERLGISHRAGHRPSHLSGGQQQRVAIARALVSQPDLLLADEPTGNLDTAHGNEVMRILDEINNEGTTLVMVTHSAEHASYAKRVVHLLDGEVTADNRNAAALSPLRANMSNQKMFAVKER